MLGFDTPSKRLAEQAEKMQAKQPSVMPGADNLIVKAEAIERVESLGQLIISEGYNAYSPEQKIHILQEFAFLSKVASCL